MNKSKRWLKTLSIILAVAFVALLTCACDSFGNGISKKDLPSGTYYPTGSPFKLGFSKLEFFDDHVLLYYDGDIRKNDDNTIYFTQDAYDGDQRKTGTYYGVYENVKKRQETVKVQGSNTEIAIKIQSALTDVDQTTLENMKNEKITVIKNDDGDVTLTQEYGDGEIFEYFSK